jgi:uncharacterized membrane protein
MPDSTKETTTVTETNENNNHINKREAPIRNESSYHTISYLIYFIFGLLNVLLAFRFVFKILGANPSTGFVSFIYSLSSIFVSPFEGIFSTAQGTGDVTASIFEPATLVAIIVYAVIAWGLVTLIRAISGRQVTS